MLLKGLLVAVLLEVLVMKVPISQAAPNAYALLGAKRDRFPVSTLPQVDDALDVGTLDAMFASHIVSEPKGPNEFRVLILGDSTTWGLQLRPEDVVSSQLNALALHCGEMQLRFYNLSFPRSSATKDILILDRALELEPDAIIWFITWYTLMPKTRADHWLITQNPSDFQRLGRRFDFLPQDYEKPSWLDVINYRNRRAFRFLRYQLYALIQLGTGQDQIAGPPQILNTELGDETTFEGLKPPTLARRQVSIDQIADLHELAGGVPILMVNEPILILPGIPNSDIRYNSYYPRWVYDQYREILAEEVARHGWNYRDLWNRFPPSDFGDTPLHLVPSAHQTLAQYLAPGIRGLCSSNPEVPPDDRDS